MRFENPMDCSKAEEFEVLPAGTYDVQIAKIESKPTQTGGMYFSIQLVVVNHPQFTKRTVYDNVNYVNSNPTAEAIGRNRLAVIGKSCGLMTLSDTDELIGRVLQADIYIEDDPHYGKSNRIKRYRASTAQASEFPQPQGMSFPQTAQAPQSPMTIGVPPQTQNFAQPQFYAQAQQSPKNDVIPWGNMQSQQNLAGMYMSRQ